MVRPEKCEGRVFNRWSCGGVPRYFWAKCEDGSLESVIGLCEGHQWDAPDPSLWRPVSEEEFAVYEVHEA